MLVDDAVRDGQAQARSLSDVLGGEERIEDPPLEPRGDPVSRIGERDLHLRDADRTRDANRLAWRVRHRVAGVRQQVDEHLLQLDGVSDDHGLLLAQVDRDLDLAQPELLLHEGKRPPDHVPQGNRLAADGGRPAERAQMRDDLGGLAHLLHGLAQLADDLPLVRHAELDEVDRVAHEQAGVVEGVIELVGHAGGELAERRELPRLDELLLFVAQLLFAPLHLGRGLPQITHDVDHGLAAVLQMKLVLVRVLKDVEQGSPRIVEPRRLASQSSAVLLVVGQDVKHRLSLVGEALVGFVQVAHDMEHRAALLVACPQAALQRLHLRAESTLGGGGRPGLANRRLTIVRHEVCHRDHTRAVFSLPSSFRRLSSSFSRAIIFSSRPTTTSSNFSRSKIFSCSSLLDFSRSRTTCSYSRMSRKMPMAPITLPSGSRSAEALRIVGITSPLALRGLSRALRVTPRSTTSRSAAVNSRVSAELMNRESDCSRSSSWRNPSNWETASLACRIFPSRSDTNTGSGAFLIKLSAYARALSSSRMSRRMPMTPIARPSGSRKAEAFKLVGMTSPLALRGFRTTLRMTPRSTTSRRAAVNSRVSSGLMKRESDCSSTSSWRNPSSWETASLACRILPSRSETNTGSGALAMMMSASSEP